MAGHQGRDGGTNPEEIRGPLSAETNTPVPVPTVNPALPVDQDRNEDGARMRAASDGSFMRPGGPELDSSLGGFDSYPSAFAVDATARLTPGQLSKFTATPEAPEDTTTPFDPDVRLPGPVVWRAEELSPAPVGHNVRVVLWLDNVATAAKPAAEPGGVARLWLQEAPAGPRVLGPAEFERIRAATLARLARVRERGANADDPVVRPRLQNVFGKHASRDGVIRFGVELEYEFRNDAGGPVSAEEAARRHGLIAEALYAGGLKLIPELEAYHASHDRKGYTDWLNDFRHEVEQIGTNAAEMTSPIMRDLPHWWLRVMTTVDIILSHGGVPLLRSNGNLHVGVPFFGGRAGAEDVSFANAMLDVFDEFVDVLYRMFHDWSAQPPGGVPSLVPRLDKDPVIPRLKDLTSAQRGRDFAINLINLLGSPLDRVEFRSLAPTLDQGSLQAQQAMVVGLMVWAWQRLTRTVGSTPQRLGTIRLRAASTRGTPSSRPTGVWSRSWTSSTRYSRTSRMFISIWRSSSPSGSGRTSACRRCGRRWAWGR